MHEKKSESRKVTETKEKIKDAFLELYAQKKIEKIGIKEITERAGVNRGTFYVYFLDIYDILDQVEEDFLVIMKEKAGKIIESVFADRDFTADLPDTKFYLRNKKYFDILIGENGNTGIIDHIKQIVRTFIRGKIGEYPFEANDKLEYVLEYMVGAHLSVITYWMKNGMQIPLEEIVSLMKDISVSGPAHFFVKKKRLSQHKAKAFTIKKKTKGENRRRPILCSNESLMPNRV